MTAINKPLADELNITDEGKVSASRIANGSIVKTRIVDIQYIKVGPKTYNSPKISIIPYKGHPEGFHGLLGQDFLSKFQYSIDYKNSQILWKE